MFYRWGNWERTGCDVICRERQVIWELRDGKRMREKPESQNVTFVPTITLGSPCLVVSDARILEHCSGENKTEKINLIPNLQTLIDCRDVFDQFDHTFKYLFTGHIGQQTVIKPCTVPNVWKKY